MNKSLYYTHQKISYEGEELNTEEGNSKHWDYIPPSKNFQPASSFQNMQDVEVAPEKIRKLIQMFQDEPWTLTRKKSFYEQALFMSDFEDNAELVPFFEYFPVYKSMNIPQLRSYFTFRKFWRRGEYPAVSLSYIFLYVYEILMQIGIGSSQLGVEILKNLKDAYSASQPKLIKYLEIWIRDYIVYYGLSEYINEYFELERKEDALAAILKDFQNVDEELLFEKTAILSSYKIKNGALFKRYPDDVVSIVSRVIKVSIPIYERRYGQSIDELCLGLRKQIPHPIFASAVFYRPDTPKEKTFEISWRRRYLCRGGLWSVDSFREMIIPKGSSVFNMILHETDRRLRISLNVKFPMASKMSDVEVERTIQKEIDRYLREKEDAACPKVTLDFSILDGIRANADLMRDALLSDVEREKEEEVTTVTEHHISAVVLKGSEDKVSAESLFFTEQESNFLQLVLDEGDWKNYLREIYLPIGVMMDRINEKFMDDMQDILIVDEGNGPHILEDYKNYVFDKIRRISE